MSTTLTTLQLALGYFENTTIAPDGSVISRYNNTMRDLVHEWNMNWLDNEPEKDIEGTRDLSRSEGVQKTPDGQTGWCATLNGQSYLYLDNFKLPSKATIVMLIKLTNVGTHGLFYFPNQMKAWIDNTFKLHVLVKGSDGNEYTYDCNSTITPDKWHTLTIGVGGNKVYVTIDGSTDIEVVTQYYNIYQPESGAQCLFGSDGTNGLIGKIDRIKIYNRVLLIQDAIEEHQNNTLLGDFPLYLYYRTPWIYIPKGYEIVDYNFTKTTVTGTDLYYYKKPELLSSNILDFSNCILILKDMPQGTQYNNIVRSTQNDTFRYVYQYLKRFVSPYETYILWHFEFKNA